LSKIRGAANEVVVKKIIEDMDGQLGARGKLTFGDYQILEQRALAQIAKTPTAKRANVYSNALDKILASTDFLDRVLPGAKERGAFVRMDFEARIADGEDPTDAFTAALDAFHTRGTVKLNAIAKPQFGPAKKLNDWTLEDVEDAREKTKAKFKGKANTMAVQLLVLNSLASYLAAKENAVSKALEEDKDGGTLQQRLKKLQGGENK